MKPHYWLALLLLLALQTPGVGTELHMTDGSKLEGDLVSLNQGTFKIRLDTGETVSIPEFTVQSILYPSRQAGEGSSTPLVFFGSNTLGERLIPKLIETQLFQAGARRMQWLPGEQPNEYRLQVGNVPAGLPGTVIIQAHGSSDAFAALAGGEKVIGMTSRAINPTEESSLSALGEMRDANVEHVLALDGIALIVHAGNPVEVLSRQQIAAIFAGEVKNWAELNGPSGQIQLYAHNRASGSFDTFNTLLLEPQNKRLSVNANHYESSEALSDAVASDPNGIGFVGLAYVRQAKALAIRECDLAYRPTRFAVKTEEYPLSRRLYLYTPKPWKTSEVKTFLSFALSLKAQDIIRELGFVDQAIEVGEDYAELMVSRLQTAILTTRNLGELQDLIELLKDAKRLSVTFRFHAGSSQPDNRALRDLDRLALYGQTLGAGRDLLLLGFSDQQGGYQANLKLSESRAQHIAKELADRGVTVSHVDGFGQEAPVACNDYPGGAARNRRVEVWIR